MHINTDFAKQQLKKIDEVLETPHIIIGGLAIQQYIKVRSSKDIDLICDSDTAKSIITELYPSKDYVIEESNDDEYRPSYEITNKINKHKIIFFGPKIIERDPYKAMDWQKLNIDSLPFEYKKEKFQKIRVPRVETLAFSKLLSFVDRINKNFKKGEQDLKDFINLSNITSFKMNILIDHIRESECSEYINKIISEAEHYDLALWNTSLFMDFFHILSPLVKKTTIVEKVFEDNFDDIYKVENSIKFYDTIADKYDERNTKYLLNTHRKVIEGISDEIAKNKKINILDIGAGTGRLIAAHFFNTKDIVWHCVEPSKNMASQFKQNMKTAQIKTLIYDCSIFDLNDKILNSSYDIIILSFVLSSLSNDPDFGMLSNLLTPNGKLIIADSDPYLKKARPFYDFKYNDKNIALTTRLIFPLDIINNCLKENLTLISVDDLESSNDEKYSFVMQFKKKIML